MQSSKGQSPAVTIGSVIGAIVGVLIVLVAAVVLFFMACFMGQFIETEFGLGGVLFGISAIGFLVLVVTTA